MNMYMWGVYPLFSVWLTRLNVLCLYFREFHRWVHGGGSERAGVPEADVGGVLGGAPPLLPQPGPRGSDRRLPHGKPLSLRQPLLRTQLRDTEVVSAALLVVVLVYHRTLCRHLNISVHLHFVFNQTVKFWKIQESKRSW